MFVTGEDDEKTKEEATAPGRARRLTHRSQFVFTILISFYIFDKF